VLFPTRSASCLAPASRVHQTGPALPAARRRSRHREDPVPPGGSAYVIREKAPGELEKDAVQISAEDTGVAIHGDKVVVRLGAGLSRPHGGRHGGEPIGRVIRILERAHETLTGNLQRTKLFFYVVPDDPRFTHDIYVPDPAQIGRAPGAGGRRQGRRQAPRMEAAPRQPEGTIVERLGRTHERAAELAAIYHKNTADARLSGDVLPSAALPSRVTVADLFGRLDYRAVPTSRSIPTTQRIRRRAVNRRNCRMGRGVGRATSPTSAVTEGRNRLDREPAPGNSTYLVGTVVPMLPEKLSNGLCSLVEGKTA